MRRTMIVFLLAACGAHPWVPMLDAMKGNRVHIEISTETQDFNKIAPATVKPSADNKWLIFFYDPVREADVHREFATRLSPDCFFSEVARAAESEDGAGKPEHAAVCVFDRVPPVPTEEQPGAGG